MQHISAKRRGVESCKHIHSENITEAELSGLTWKVITAKESSIESEFFCYDLRLTSQRPAQHKSALSFFSLTRRAHSRRNERLNAHINAFGDYHRVYINFVLTATKSLKRKSGMRNDTFSQLLHLLSIINHSILSHLHLTFCTLMALLLCFSCSRIYN